MSLETKDVVAAFRKHPVGFAAGVLAVALGLASYFRGGAVDGLAAALEERTREGTRQQTNLKYAARLDEHLAAVTAANATIASRAVDPRALATNLQYFYELEAALQLKLTELRQGGASAPAAGAAYVAVPYMIALEAPYEQAVRFLQALEQGERYVRFVSATLQPRAADAPDAGAPRATGPLVTLNLTVELLATP